MFERYTEGARRSLFFARYEASMLGSVAIETHHLLLGLLKERDPLMTHLLADARLSADALRKMIYTRADAGTSPIALSVEIPFSRNTKHRDPEPFGSGPSTARSNDTNSALGESRELQFVSVL